MVQAIEFLILVFVAGLIWGAIAGNKLITLQIDGRKVPKLFRHKKLEDLLTLLKNS